MSKIRTYSKATSNETFKEYRARRDTEMRACITGYAGKELETLARAFAALGDAVTPMMSRIDCSENTTEALFASGTFLQMIRDLEASAFTPVERAANEAYQKTQKERN